VRLSLKVQLSGSELFGRIFTSVQGIPGTRVRAPPGRLRPLLPVLWPGPPREDSSGTL
jgi:hypothetical protein